MLATGSNYVPIWGAGINLSLPKLYIILQCMKSVVDHNNTQTFGDYHR